MVYRPRRSVLYMPASNERAIAKAHTLPCDVVILDLEDGVAAEAKASARERACEAIKAQAFGNREVILRINGIDSPWWIQDVGAAAQAKPDGILLPKVSSVETLTVVADRMVDISADHKVRIWAMMESALAMLNAATIAAAARDVEMRLAGFVLGTNDLARETRARVVPGRAPMVPWMMNCIAAARAYHITVLDGAFNDFADTQGFVRECREAAEMGFDGKTLIHPSQIEACNAAFSPSAAEIMQARRIIALFEAPENRGKGAVAIDGRVVQKTHVDVARRTLALADAIAHAH